MPQSTAIHAPRQTRSRRTQDRILDAAVALLTERRFEAISVADIVSRAGVSVGAFYARFTSREAVLQALYERHDTALHERFDSLDADPPPPTLRAAAERHVRSILEHLRANRALLREVALYARLHPDAIGAEIRDRRRAMHQRWRTPFLRFADAIEHDEPERAIDEALFVIGAAAREMILFPDAPHAQSSPIDDASLERCLVRMLLMHLAPVGAAGDLP